MSEQRMQNGFVWVDDLPNHRDDLAPAKGMLNGIAISAMLVAVIATGILVGMYLFG